MRSTKTKPVPVAPAAQAERIWNHYRCEQCGQLTIAKHEDPGVTPFMLECRATAGCAGSAFSLMYCGPQDEAQRPHVIFFRPERPRVDAVILAEVEAMYRRGDLPGMDRRARAAIVRGVREHYDKGGCLMRLAKG